MNTETTNTEKKHIRNYKRAINAVNKYFERELSKTLILSGEGGNSRYVRKRWQKWLDAVNAADLAPKLHSIKFYVEKKTRATARLYLNGELVATGHGGGSQCGGFSFVDAACAQAVGEYGMHNPVLLRFCIENWRFAGHSWGFFQDSYMLPMLYPSSGMSGFSSLFYKVPGWDYDTEWSKTCEIIKAWKKR